MLPTGLANGVPKSLQLISCRLDEGTSIRAGSAYEVALGFDRHPMPWFSSPPSGGVRQPQLR